MNEGAERRLIKNDPLRQAFQAATRALYLAERRMNEPRPLTMVERQQIATLSREALDSLIAVRGTL